MILLLGTVTVFHFLRTENCDTGNMYGILLDNHFYCPTNALNYTKLRG